MLLSNELTLWTTITSSGGKAQQQNDNNVIAILTRVLHVFYNVGKIEKRTLLEDLFLYFSVNEVERMFSLALVESKVGLETTRFPLGAGEPPQPARRLPGS